jgi:hypothetical protein
MPDFYKMTDLTSNVLNLEIKDLQILLAKYSPIIELIKEKDKIPHLVYIFEYTINYINSKHNTLTKDWKTFTTIVVKNQFLNKKIQSESDIENTIDDFVLYWNAEYQNYIDDLALFDNEIDRDLGFCNKYISQKNH